MAPDSPERLRKVAEKYLDAQESMPSDQAVLETELESFEDLRLRGIILTVPDGREAFFMNHESCEARLRAALDLLA